MKDSIDISEYAAEKGYEYIIGKLPKKLTLKAGEWLIIKDGLRYATITACNKLLQADLNKSIRKMIK